MTRYDKIQKLVEAWGMSSIELIKEATMDSVAAGICTNADCDYTTEVEPDSRDGWCEECNTGSVSSILILTGMI